MKKHSTFLLLLLLFVGGFCSTAAADDYVFDLSNVEFSYSDDTGGSWDASTGILITPTWGNATTRFSPAIDLSEYRYVVVVLGEKTVTSSYTSMYLYDVDYTWGGESTYLEKELHNGAGTYILELSDVAADGVSAFDRSTLYEMRFGTAGGEDHQVQINRIYATNSFPDYEIDLSQIDPNLTGSDGSWDADNNILITSAYGYGGVHFSSSLDLSAYNYLVVELGDETKASGYTYLRVFDTNNIWGDNTTYGEVQMNGAATYYFDLQGLAADGVTAFDPSSIYYIAIQTAGEATRQVQINRIYATNSFPDYEIDLSQIDPNLTGSDGSWDADNNILITSAYGYGGVHFSSSLDLSAYNYLVVELGDETKASGYTYLRVFDSNNIWENDGTTYGEVQMNGAGTYYFDLQGLAADGVTAFDPSSVYYIAIQTAGEATRQVQINRIYATNNILLLTMGDVGYLTCYTSRSFMMPVGLAGNIVTKVNDETAALQEAYPAGSSVPAGTALVLSGTAGSYIVDLSGESNNATVSGNMLYGSDTRCETYVPNADSSDYYFYMLSTNSEGEVGFYWGADNGAAFTSGAHKAWLAVPVAEGNSLRFLSFGSSDSTATGIAEAPLCEVAPAAPTDAIYTIQGVRVQDMSKKGLYIVNGKKVLVR